MKSARWWLAAALVISAVAGCTCDVEPVEQIDCDFTVKALGGDTIDFGTVAVNADVRSASFVIENIGNRPLNAFTIDFSGNGSHYGVDVPADFLVTPGDDEALIVVFRPTQETTLNAEMRISHIDLGANANGLLDACRIAATLDVGPTLVVATDHLVAYRDRVADVLSAGAATAFLVDPGKSGFATLGPQARAADEVFDVWLLGREQEPRFRLEVLFDSYGKVTARAAKALAAITKRETGRYTSICPSQPHPQVLRSLGKLGARPEQIEGTSFVGDIGNVGAASVGLALCLGLDASRKGSSLLALAYGGGEAVAQEITVTAKPKGIGTRGMIDGGEPIALGTYYRWTEGRQQQPH